MVDRSPISSDRISSDRIAFEPVASRHDAMLLAWLGEPHVREWWGDPAREIALIREGREDGSADGFVALLDDEPCAYIQSWRPSGHPDEDVWCGDEPPDTIAIDVFIGPPAMLGRGVGSAVVRTFAERLVRDGARRVVIDPDAPNLRAVRAYERAGFATERRFDTPEGGGLLMVFRPDHYAT